MISWTLFISCWKRFSLNVSVHCNLLWFDFPKLFITIGFGSNKTWYDIQNQQCITFVSLYNNHSFLFSIIFTDLGGKETFWIGLREILKVAQLCITNWFRHYLLGNMVTDWLESILIGDVFQCDDLAIRSGPCDFSSNCQFFVFWSQVVNNSRFFTGNAIRCLVAVKKSHKVETSNCWFIKQDVKHFNNLRIITSLNFCIF